MRTMVAALLLALTLNACATSKQGSTPSGDGPSHSGEAAAPTGTKSDEGPPQRSGGCAICVDHDTT